MKQLKRFLALLLALVLALSLLGCSKKGNEDQEKPFRVFHPAFHERELR